MPNHLPESPYKGLIPYSEEDADFFFGRKSEQEIITANLMASRLTLLYGPSGVGKSSVLRAGVSHSLQELSRRNFQVNKTPEFAVVVFRSWSADPLSSLLASINNSIAQAFKTAEPQMPRPSESLVKTLKQWTELLEKDDQRLELFVILDQFEEYFLYHSNEEGEGTFAAEFPKALNQTDLHINFLISLREDWLSRLDFFKGRIPNLFDNYLRIDHLDRNSAKEAITRPIEKYNDLLDRQQAPIVAEDILVEEVLKQLVPLSGRTSLAATGRGAAKLETTPVFADERIQTPYLQLVMTRIWEKENERWKTGSNGERKMRAQTLHDLGGAERIVQTHVENVMNKLKPEQQAIASRIFDYLVTESNTKIAYSAAGLASKVRTPEPEITRLLDTLCEKSNSILTPIVSPPDKKLGARYEIYHDVLAQAILDWQAHYEQRQSDIRAEQNLIRERAEAKRREADKEQELAQARRIAGIERERAQDQQARAEAERERAETQIRLVEVERQRAEEQQRLVEEQENRLVEREKSSKRLKAAAAALGVVCVLTGILAVLALRFAEESKQLRIEGERLRQQGISLEQAGREAQQQASVFQAEGESLRRTGEIYRLEGLEAERKAARFKEEAIKRKEEAARLHLQATELEARAARSESDAEEAKRANDVLLHTIGIREEEAQRALGLAETARSINVLYQEASNLEKSGDLRAALDKYSQTVPLYEIAKDRPGQAATLTSIGSIYDRLNENDFAIGSYIRAQEYYASVGALKEQASTYIKIADSYNKVNAGRDKAVENYKEAARIYKSIEDYKQEANTLIKIGKAYVEDKNPASKEQAKDWFDKSIKVYDRAGDDSGKASTLTEIARIYGGSFPFSRPDLESRKIATDYYKSAAEIYSKAGESDKAERTLATIVQLFRTTGDQEGINSLISASQELLQIYKATNDLQKQASTYRSIGLAYFNLGSAEAVGKATENLDQALTIYQRTKNRAGEAFALSSLGYIHRTTDKKKARDFYKRALDIYKEVGDVFGAEQARRAKDDIK